MRLNTNQLRNGSHSRYNAELARLMIIIQNSCTTLDAADQTMKMRLPTHPHCL